jgi:hypothetical protein
MADFTDCFSDVSWPRHSSAYTNTQCCNFGPGFEPGFRAWLKTLAAIHHVRVKDNHRKSSDPVGAGALEISRYHDE